MSRSFWTVLAIATSLYAGSALAAAEADDTSLAQQFEQLDTNGDGVLSQSEAQSDVRVAALYESLDTRATIEDDAANTTPDGITQAQFEAGMTAARQGGTVGPSASGGERYKVYPDGSSEKIDGTGVGAAKNR